MHATNEVIRACASCQKEHGVTAVPGTSHGYCQRHLVAMWRQLPASPAMESKIADILARPATEFPPDLGELREAA